MLLSDVWSDLRETAYVIRKGGKSSSPVHCYCHSQENPCQTPYPYMWPYWRWRTTVSKISYFPDCEAPLSAMPLQFLGCVV